MAKNTTATGSVIDGVTVVHPDNMGHTLVFKDKVYNVNVGDNGLVDVKLSNASGNLLQKRDDGLYYGITPPVNLANLYVDAVNGVDQHPDEVDGAGTRAKPLKTLAYAASLSRPYTNYSIWLREDQEHNVIASTPTSFKEGRIGIQPYGPLVDSLLQTLPHRTAVHDKLCELRKNPVIKFTGYITTTDKGVTDTVRLSCTSLYIPLNSGVTLDGVSMRNVQEVFTLPSGVTTSIIRGYNRISCVGSFYFTRGLLFNEGTPSMVNGNPAVKGGLSMFGFVYTLNGACTWYSIANVSENLSCFLNTHQGASTVLGSGSSIDVNTNDTTLSTFVGQRIYGAIIDEQNGVRFVVAPSTNLRAQYFP